MGAPPVANLCKLKKDKAIGAQKNFAKTFNWLVDSMKNLQGGIACNVNWVAENMPVIDVNTYVTGDRTEDPEVVTPDADVAVLSDVAGEELSALSSLQKLTMNPEADLSAQVKVLQLFNFDLSDTITIQLSDENNPPTPEGEEEQLSSGYDFIIRKDGKVQYAKLSAHAYPVDSIISSAQTSSFQTRDLEDGNRVLQLYKFNETSNLKNQVQLSTEMSSLLPEHYEFLVRKTDNDKKTLEYMSISAACLAGGEGLPPDADTPNSETSSIQVREVSSGDKMLELYDFHNLDNVLSVQLSSQNRYDFLMRDQHTHQLAYTHLSGVGGEVTLSGTDSSSHTGNEFKFQSASDSNIIVNVDANGNITIGCYYL